MNLVARAKLVRHLNFPSPAKPRFTNAAAIQHCNSYATRARARKKDPVGDLWRDLVRNPLQWYDYRGHKLNELVSVKHPGFKRKDRDEVLWANTIPPWVLPGIESLKFDVKDVQRESNKDAKREDLWKSLVEDPSKWWDNRVAKKTPEAPDFKHKETGEGLWISSAPSRIIPELENLKFDVKEDVPSGGKKDAGGEILWKSLVEDPSKWWDNRARKKSPKAPDFKHRETGEALWINSAPSWVIPELEDLRCVRKDVSVGGGKKKAKGDDLWKRLLEEPSKWQDNRAMKKNPKAPDFKHREPDFKHRETGEALWINSAPSWVIPELEDLRCDLWKRLLEDPSKWRDNRARKKNLKAPDFKHRETGEALWMNSAPSWVIPELFWRLL